MFLLKFLWLHQIVLALSGPPAPVNVDLESANFSHVLRWDRGAGTPPGVTYSVTFKTDRGYSSEVVRGCERLVTLVCNLTEAFSDPEEIYHTLVTAQFNSGESSTPIKDFHPIKDTKLDPPVLRVVQCNSSVCVYMDAPLPHLRSIYNSFWYELKAQNSPHAPEKHLVKSLQPQRLPWLGAGSKFCVSVRFSDDTVPRHSNFSSPQCVHITSPFPATEKEYLLATLLCFAALVFLLLLALLFRTGFFCLRKPALPSVLNSVHHSEEPMDVLCHPSDSSLLNVETVTPPHGRTGSCSSDTDSSEDEEDVKDSADRGGAITPLYTTKASFSSSISTGPSTNQSAVSSQGRPGEPEEVNLLTLTFGRETVERTHSLGFEPEPELPLCELKEEDEEQEEDYDTQTGYMSR